MKKNILKSAVLMMLIAACLCSFSCSKSSKQLKRMQQLEEGVSNPSTPDELKSAIDKYDERIDEIISATQQTGIWWKLLGSRYLDNQMYGKALEAYQKAITFYPANQNLYYYIGVCAGYMAESALDYTAQGDFSEKERYLALSESAYLRAIELEPKYSRALYGVAVLYVFLLDEPSKAIPHLEKLLSFDTKHTEAMMVLARAYYSEKQFQKAVDMYDRLIATTTDDTMKADAERNKKVVLDALYSN